jgi:hypothetical protein
MKEARLCGPSLSVITGAQTETGGFLCNVDSLSKNCANRRAARNELRTAVQCSVSNAKKPQYEVVDLPYPRRRAESGFPGRGKCCFLFRARR